MVIWKFAGGGGLGGRLSQPIKKLSEVVELYDSMVNWKFDGIRSSQINKLVLDTNQVKLSKSWPYWKYGDLLEGNIEGESRLVETWRAVKTRSEWDEASFL